MSTRYNGVPNAYNTHQKTCDSVGAPYIRELREKVVCFLGIQIFFFLYLRYL